MLYVGSKKRQHLGPKSFRRKPEPSILAISTVSAQVGETCSSRGAQAFRVEILRVRVRQEIVDFDTPILMGSNGFEWVVLFLQNGVKTKNAPPPAKAFFSRKLKSEGFDWNSQKVKTSYCP